MLRALFRTNPGNRWEKTQREYDCGEAPREAIEVYADDTRDIISENDSPDISFRFSVNPYRGCAHGCAYCYARPSHEYLGFGAGTDFERKLVAKTKAGERLREAFERRRWAGELLVMSGITDCYQPLEAELGLTRQCLEVCAEYRNPVYLITKSALIERDMDLLVRLAEVAAVGVTISVTFWDAEVARAIEPYAPPPRRRIETIRRLARAGIPVAVNVAPLIPGLSDHALIPILEAAREAGAVAAASIPLRLPGSVAQVFSERVQAALPLRAEKILRRTREMRSGRLNDPRFFSRMEGQGQYAATLRDVFSATARRLGFTGFPELRKGTFRRPTDGGQLRLFDR